MNEFKTNDASMPIVIEFDIDSHDGSVIITGFKIDRSEINDDDILDMFSDDILEQEKQINDDIKLEIALERLTDIKAMRSDNTRINWDD